MATIIAIGGEGPIVEGGKIKKRVMAENAHKQTIARTGKKHPKVLYIPTAKNDNEDYIVGFRKYYTGLGCKDVDVLRLLNPRTRPTKEDIAAKIFSADAIYVNGGNTHRALVNWRRYGVDKMLSRAYRQGIILAGHSAGASCWFSFVCSDSFYKKQPFRLTGMGLVEAVICPHYDTESVRQPVLKKIMKRTPRLVAIALDENAAIEITDDTYQLVPTVPAAKARRTFYQHGEYFIEEIKPTATPRDLNGLLSKPNQ
jgi:dipeptidase E